MMSSVLLTTFPINVCNMTGSQTEAYKNTSG